MARGFGATFGSGATDAITSTLTSRAAQRTVHIASNRNGTGGSGFGRLWEQSNTSATGRYQFFIDGANGRYQFQVDGESGGLGGWYFTAPATGAWRYLTLVYDGSAETNDPVIYMDGSVQSITEVSAFTAGALYTATTNAFVIGNRAAGDRVWDGSQAEFAVWDALLTAEDAAALGKGVSPINIRPDAMVEYIPMIREVTSWKRDKPTTTGTAAQPHPRIHKLYRRLGGIFKIVSGGGGPTTTNISLDATLNFGPAFVKQVGKITTATTVAIAGTVLSVGKTLTATTTYSATMEALRVILLALSATLNFSTTFVKQVGKNVAAGTTATAVFTRQMGLSLAATTISVVGSTMQVGKTLGATVTYTAVMTTSRVTLLTLAATLNMTAGLLKMVGLTQAAQAVFSAAMTVSATVAPVVTPVRPFTGFGGLGWSEAKTRWSLRKRTWKPRR